MANKLNYQHDYVKFVDTSTEVKKAMHSLSKKALRRSGKVVTKILKSKVPVKTGGLQKSIRAWAKIDYKTGQPELYVGYLSHKKMIEQYHIRYWVNPAWFEFGTRAHTIVAGRRGRRGSLTGHKTLTDGVFDYGKQILHPGMGGKNFLRNTVFDNIQEIKQAQTEHLRELNELIVKSGGKIPYADEGDDLIE